VLAESATGVADTDTDSINRLQSIQFEQRGILEAKKDPAKSRVNNRD
jgi:hypothetical protein